MLEHAESPPDRVLTLPDTASAVLSIRAKAMLFHDPRSAELLERAERVARSEASVLVIGETGTGKELIARHLHAGSGRKGPFVAVNCGAFSETLIDAELFGHESGAFTGASKARAGWFEAANGVTLFLDEIGDLPLALQVKLLRVLQERQKPRTWPQAKLVAPKPSAKRWPIGATSARAPTTPAKVYSSALWSGLSIPTTSSNSYFLAQMGAA